MSVASTVARRPFVRQGDRDAAAAGADVRDRERTMPIGMELERGLDDQLGLGPRNQDCGRHLERQAPELARADDVGERLAGGAPGDQRVESSGEFGRLGVPSVGDQARSVSSRAHAPRAAGRRVRLRRRDAGFAQLLARGGDAFMNGQIKTPRSRP